MTVSASTIYNELYASEIALLNTLDGYVTNNVNAVTQQTYNIDLNKPYSTTITSASNQVNINTYTGAGVINVASTTNFPTSGTLIVTASNNTSPSTSNPITLGSFVNTGYITYTGLTSTTFTGCTVTPVGLTVGLLVTGMSIYLYTNLTNQTSYSAILSDLSTNWTNAGWTSSVSGTVITLTLPDYS